MPGSKHRRDRPARSTVARPGPPADSHEIESIIGQKPGPEARDALEALARRYPTQPGVLGALVNMHYDLHDLRGYQSACERLIRLTPDDPDVTLGLAGAYLGNIHPFLALRMFRRFLDRWPNHARAAEVRETATDLEERIKPILVEMGLTGEDGPELAILHEQSQAATAQGDYSQAHHLAERLLRRRPDFVPALNNRSLIDSLDGRLDQAIATAQRVLAIDPGNVHALSNLIRYLCMSGRVDEARDWAEKLKAASADRFDVWTKKAEGLSCLGDDQGVLEALDSARAADQLVPSVDDGLLCHLAAVAALRLGREDEARRHWDEALKLAPGLEVARANLADLRRPVGERHAPWAFTLAHWVSRKALEDLVAQTRPVARRSDDQAATEAVRRYLRQHPEMTGLLPILLDRGDPKARELAVRTATLVGTPELLEALRDFATGQRGPDKLRLEAAQAAVEAGLLPSGKVRFWTQGEWHEVLLLGFEIHDEPVARYSPRVRRWLTEAIAALRRGAAGRAERLLKQALAAEPDAPPLLNNLAAAYMLQGREAEAETVFHQLHERNPDYLFARVALARMGLKRGKIDEAKALLEPLLSRRRLHRSEFAALCEAQIELLQAEGLGDGARSWLDMWAKLDPDNPLLDAWRRRLGQPGWLRSLLGLRR